VVKRLGAQSDEGLANSLFTALENVNGSTDDENIANAVAYILLASRSNWIVPVLRRSSYLDLATAITHEHTHPALQHMLLACEVETAIILCRPTREPSDPALPDSDPGSDAYILAYSGLSVIINTFMYQMSRHRQSMATLVSGIWPAEKQSLYTNEKRALLNSKFDLMAWEEKHSWSCSFDFRNSAELCVLPEESDLLPWQRYTLTLYARAISALSEAVDGEKGCAPSLQALRQHIQSAPDMLVAVMTGTPSSLPARVSLELRTPGI
jgi:hypothetical protein